MSAKDKAKELFLKFQGFSIDDINAKQCALIAVDEILSFDLKAKSEPQFVVERRVHDYWEEVKQEIINI